MRAGDVVADRFEIEAVAGTGGMGIVYRARDRATQQPVALKTLSGVGERDAARFVREAAVLAELVHPNIVRYVAHGVSAEHQHYIVMEWLAGETLQVRLARGRLGVAESITVVRAVAEALAIAHKRGVVHRDIKPINLMLPDDELANVKLLDFGIARHVAHAGVLTHTGTVMGTPGYMAPEQVRGETSLDPRTDVFALGCVLYRCLTGTPAFGGEESLAVLAKILVEDVIPPSTIAPEVPPALDALIARMLAKLPSQRPADGAEVVARLSAMADATLREASADTLPAHSTEKTASVLTVAEQRLVSVVLSGPLSGSADTAADLERLSTTATAYGGRLERIADGANLVLFGHGVATDHATRAARCALALRDVLPHAPLVVASGRAALDRLPVGDVIDRAVTALRDLAPGQIAIDEPTAVLLDERYVVSDRGDRRLLRGMREDGEMARTVLGRTTALVGRDRELAMLEGLWAEAADEHVARAVLITAPPGAGKSRLRSDLVRRVLQRDEHAELLMGRGDAVRAGSPFALLADLIRRAAGVREGDSLDHQRAGLLARALRCSTQDGGERIAHLLGEIAGIAFPHDASEALRVARGDPAAKNDVMRAAFVDWLAAECASHPVLLVLEDVHWGDRPTIDYVDAALRQLAHQPLVVVALARPEIHDTFPKLWAERDLQEVRLPALTKKAGERLVRDLLGDGVTSETVARIVDRSAGNAFFLEELVRAVAEGRDELPDSVLSMLQQRLDQLGAEPKRALRAASVFGEAFWLGGVAALTGSDPRALITTLVERELIAAQPESRLPGEIEYAFRHDLVREAAYQTMGANDRTLGHRLAGEWLVAHQVSDPLVLAHHFSIGGNRERAAELYTRAAEQAMVGNDNAAAKAHAQLALDHGASGELAGRAHLVRAEALNWSGLHRDAAEAGETAAMLLPPGSANWFKAQDERFYGVGRWGQIPVAVVVIRELTTATALPGAELHQIRSIARAAIVMFRFGPPGLGDTLLKRVEELQANITIDLSTEQRLYSVRALAARARGNVDACIEYYVAALKGCQTTHNLREEAFTYLAYGGVFQEIGATERALPLFDRGIEVAAQVGANTVAMLLYFSRSLCWAQLRRIAEARADCNRAIAMCGEHDQGVEGFSRYTLAKLAFEDRDLDESQRQVELALPLVARMPEYGAFATAQLARIQLARGELAAAGTTIAKSKAMMRPHDGIQDGESFVRLVEIEILEATGDEAATRVAVAEAIARLETRAARIEPQWRPFFLGKRENAETLARR